jgi:hypothetical protein
MNIDNFRHKYIRRDRRETPKEPCGIAEGLWVTPIQYIASSIGAAESPVEY